MDDYGIDDALEDLDALDRLPMTQEEHAERVTRVRGLLHQLQKASVLMDDDS